MTNREMAMSAVRRLDKDFFCIHDLKKLSSLDRFVLSGTLSKMNLSGYIVKVGDGICDVDSRSHSFYYNLTNSTGGVMRVCLDDLSRIFREEQEDVVESVSHKIDVMSWRECDICGRRDSQMRRYTKKLLLTKFNLSNLQRLRDCKKQTVRLCTDCRHKYKLVSTEGLTDRIMRWE